MAQILQFNRKNAFLTEETTAMGEAYDAALSTLNYDAKSELFVRELLAKRIVQATAIGEDDRERLRQSGLSGYSKPRFRACCPAIKAGPANEDPTPMGRRADFTRFWSRVARCFTGT
jgi:hypothetical protein